MSERCPYAITKRAGDESITYCEETDRASGMKTCLMEYGYECETYNEYLEELEQGRRFLEVD